MYEPVLFWVLFTIATVVAYNLVRLALQFLGVGLAIIASPPIGWAIADYVGKVLGLSGIDLAAVLTKLQALL